MNQQVYHKLLETVKEENILLEEPMKKHTTFRVGGAADFFLTPENKEEVRHAVLTCIENKVPYYIIGNGSNLLVSDKGYRGAVIQLYKKFSQVEINNHIVSAQAGASLAKIAGASLEAELTGFEFAAGIPGTLGGACTMNAGAYGGEMKDVLLEVTVLNANGQIFTIPAEGLELGYRTSIIAKKEYIVLSAKIQLKQGQVQDIRDRIEELKIQRITKQPLEYPSAGSTFKRPEGFFAGKLIQDAGLRGLRVGDAQVSKKHCGFVINRGNATAAEIDELIKKVSEEVFQKFDVVLEPEVKRLGEF